MPEPEKPGFLDRLRARYPWFDHVMRAQERYRDCKGDHFAAGISYFTVFAAFPMLMVGFALAGFALAWQPQLLDNIEQQIQETLPGPTGEQVAQLMHSAVDARTSVGIFGMSVALWVGLSWMNNLREGLSEMWEQRRETGPFIRTKLKDLVALASAGLAIVATVGMTALSDRGLMRKVLGWFGIHDVPGLSLALQAVSLLFAVGISWLLFTVAIARLPREKLTFTSAAGAGLIAAVGFEVFKQIGAVYLGAVVRGPAGATFGPVVGLLLFATAWAATSTENLVTASVPPPNPAVITLQAAPRGIAVRDVLAAMAAGAVGALGLSWLSRRK